MDGFRVCSHSRTKHCYCLADSSAWDHFSAHLGIAPVADPSFRCDHIGRLLCSLRCRASVDTHHCVHIEHPSVAHLKASANLRQCQTRLHGSTVEFRSACLVYGNCGSPLHQSGFDMIWDDECRADASNSVSRDWGCAAAWELCACLSTERHLGDAGAVVSVKPSGIESQGEHHGTALCDSGHNGGCVKACSSCTESQRHSNGTGCHHAQSYAVCSIE